MRKTLCSTIILIDVTSSKPWDWQHHHCSYLDVQAWIQSPIKKAINASSSKEMRKKARERITRLFPIEKREEKLVEMIMDLIHK